METLSFINNGYHYFLEECQDGYCKLNSDADYLQYLKANEKEPGIITSITNGEIILLTLGQKFGDKVVSEILRVEGETPTFKVKLSLKES